MNTLVELINAFCLAEFECNVSAYDIMVSDEDYELLALRARSFCLYSVPNTFARPKSILQVIGDPKWESRYLRTKNEFVSRKLLQVRVYRNARLGNVLAPVVQSDFLYGCLLSYDQDAGRPMFLSSEYFVAETADGLKIIYDRSFNTKDGTWNHSHDHAPTRVEDPGTLVEVQNFVAPEDEVSLKEYLRVSPH